MVVVVTDPRQTRAWRKLRDRVVAEEPVCRLQFPGICTQVSTTADHIETYHDRPDLGLARSNHRGTCEPCNRARGHTPESALAHAPRPSVLSVFD